MKTGLLILVAYVLGFLTAIPVGASQIEIAKRALKHQMRAAVMVIIGSIVSDLMYGSIAFFGLAPFLEDRTVIAYFGLASAAVLLVLAFLTLRYGTKAHVTDMDYHYLKSGRWSLVTGFSLAVTNPVMVFWWLIGAKIVKELGIISSFTTTASVLFLIFGALGLASYLTLLAMVLQWTKRFITDDFMHRINLALGVLLVLLAGYFVVGSLRVLL